MSESLSQWDEEALRARVCDSEGRTRHAAGSPDEAEIAAYAAALPNGSEERTAVVLGMTPELRRLVTSRFARTVSVDASTQSIQMYRDWVDEEFRSRETIVQGGWLALPQYIPGGAAAVVGDGVFGNLPHVEAHRELLAAVREVLQPGGRFITRKVMVPRGFDASECSVPALLRQHRQGELDDAEFGFGVRLLGHYACCYDSQTCILDNAKLFAECEEMWRQNEFTDEEYACIRRYCFSGNNSMVTQDLWEQLLDEAGFAFQVRRCRGRHWYGYYMVYETSLRD